MKRIGIIVALLLLTRMFGEAQAMLVNYELSGNLALSNPYSPDVFGLQGASFVYSVLLDTEKPLWSRDDAISLTVGTDLYPATWTIYGSGGANGAYGVYPTHYEFNDVKSPIENDYMQMPWSSASFAEGEFIINWTIYLRNDFFTSSPIIPTSLNDTDISYIDGKGSWDLQWSDPANWYGADLLFINTTLNVTPVPEPNTLLLVVSGCAGLGLFRRFLGK